MNIKEMYANIENKKLVFGYLLLIVAVFLYSFTQVDLSLTLSRASVWQDIQKNFQYIGYFNRPLSTVLYLLLLFCLFTFYLVFLSQISRKKLKSKTVWTTIVITTFILTFSYNAFSHDLFNYIFDAKIVTFYNQNPYFHKALDFPGDPMLSFMHWTHRLYPYGPIWLALTVPLSFLGFQLFLPTALLFKGLMSATFLGSAFLVGKIVKKMKPDMELFSVVFFALNPLLLIESLVSAHNDIVMIFLSLWALYLLITRKYIFSFVLFVLSVGVKFATAFLFPVFVLLLIQLQKEKKINWDLIGLLIVIVMSIGVVVASVRTNFQPWYLLYVLPYCALVARKFYILIPSVLLSLFGLLHYAPYLYIGNWDPPVPSLLFNMLTSSVMISMVGIFIWYIRYIKSK